MSKKNQSDDRPKIGDIVSFKSHYLKGNKELLDSELFIGGDDKSISPLMFITELLKETKSKYHEETGEEIISKESWNCKVVWFDSKSYTFKETRINSKYLHLIKEASFNKIAIGSNVILKTNAFEIKKQRINTLKNDSGSTIKLSSLLSYSAPEMIVTGTKKSNPKKPLKDQITGDQIRYYPTQLLKCKYFNPIGNKYSEELLPAECLNKADYDESKINELIDIKNKDLIVLIEDSLYKVKNLIYLHGIYKTELTDFINQEVTSFIFNEIKIKETFNFDDLIAEKLAPIWNGETYLSISDFLKDRFDKKGPQFVGKYFFIEYKNRKGKFTQRFIYVDKILNPQKEKENNKKKDQEKKVNLFVKAYCFLRKDERTFNFNDDRLLSIHSVSDSMIKRLENENSE